MAKLRRRKAGPRLTPSGAKNLVGVAKVLGPAVLPVVAPYLLKAASVAREGVDRARARRLGVDVARLGEFSGRGGALHARIVGASDSVAELAGVQDADQDFVRESGATLAKLATAVRAAERMPTARRKAAYRAVARELDPIERGLLSRLGIS
jgi:uncharacterized protein DUF6474